MPPKNDVDSCRDSKTVELCDPIQPSMFLRSTKLVKLHFASVNLQTWNAKAVTRLPGTPPNRADSGTKHQRFKTHEFSRVFTGISRFTGYFKLKKIQPSGGMTPEFGILAASVASGYGMLLKKLDLHRPEIGNGGPAE